MSALGRPREASKELLQEAAFELFQLRGYRATTVERIAKTAGFSRATFFNFFAAKADVFWVETDELIDALRRDLLASLEAENPPPLREALLRHAETVHSSAIPWALTNLDVLQADDDLVASGAGRVLGVQRLFTDYLRAGEGRAADPLTKADAAAITARLLVGLSGWIGAGVGRGALREFLERVL